MLWKRGNHNQIRRNTELISTDITVRIGGFYSHEKPAHPANQLLCMEQRYEDSDPGFPQFMRLCGAQILSQYSFVLEHLESFKDSLEHAPFAAGYQSLGGNVICRTASTLISVSEYDSPKLLQLIPEDSLLQYRYYGYGYCRRDSGAAGAPLERTMGRAATGADETTWRCGAAPEGASRKIPSSATLLRAGRGPKEL